MLSPKPKEIEHIQDWFEVSIDPHMSIHAMVDMIKGFAVLLNFIGFEIIKNTTGRSFITSDNPVVCFDPDTPEEFMKPYFVDRMRKRAELFFPLDDKHVLHGHSALWYKYREEGITFRNSQKLTEIERINRLQSKFAYETVFAKSADDEDMIQKYAGLSPVPHIESIPYADRFEMRIVSRFGSRRKKVKWEEKRPKH